MSSKKRYRDPHASREAENYENPVPSRELILEVFNDQGRPLSFADVKRLLEVGEDGEVGLERRLKAMLRDAQLMQTRSGKLGVVSRMDLIAGRVQAHKDGFGYVIPDDKQRSDLYIAPRQMRHVLDGDHVLVSDLGFNRFGKKEARIVEITERGTTEVVGRYFREAGVGFIEPDNRRITSEVLVEDKNGIRPNTGDHVRATITQYPSRDQHMLVRLEEVIASPDQAGMEVDVALRRFEIPFVWPEGVEAAAQKLGDSVPQKESNQRVDLRDLPLVTIDGEDARDFDDAVYVEARPRGGWRLIVAIADVSHYVQPGSPLDKEAAVRGNSVYFPNRVIPMLPEALSNGLCSLNPNVDRLCLFCDMQVSANGRVSKFVFREGVMRSRHRLTYTKVGAMIEEPESALVQETVASLDDETIEMIWAYHAMFLALRGQRETRGAIDFDSDETRIIYDDNKKIEAIVPVVRNVAHIMIEEAMLAANVCAAHLLEQSGLPVLYRNHDAPKEERLTKLQQFLGGLGLSLGWSKGAPKPAVFQTLREEVAERPDRHVIQTMMLRTMSQAMYEAESKGHFGLAYKRYTHFTSPIRRYPDLLVHRAIRYLIRSDGVPGKVENPTGLPVLPQPRILPYDTAQMVGLGEQCSMTERRADDATRDVVSWLKCQFMEDHIGDVFEGVISGVTNFGLFVQLEGLHIDGLVHIANLDSDYYHFDDVGMALVGESSGRRFSLGDSVTVCVAAVHTEDRKIDLQLESSTPAKGRPKKARKGAAAGGVKGSGKGSARGDGKRDAKGGAKGGTKSEKSAKGKSKTRKSKTQSASQSGSERERLAKGDIPSKPKPKAKRKGPPRGKKAARRRK